jgi:hypothetical protein
MACLHPRSRCNAPVETDGRSESITRPMTLIKCPHCPRQFESVAASRRHAESAHGKPDPAAGDTDE